MVLFRQYCQQQVGNTQMLNIFGKILDLLYTNISINISITAMKINQMSYLPKLPSKEKINKQDSPFSIPEDAEIFRMKEKEKDKRREERAENSKLKIWQKGVKQPGLTMKEINELAKGKDTSQNNQAKISLIQAAKNAIKNRVKVNEPMHQFVSKKRETLLFQMLIDHKREKINQFQDLERLHRKGLERAEQMLEEDMEAFNSYLNQNKREARDAIKKAEKQTKQKNDKVAIIKVKLEEQAELTGKNMSKKEIVENLKKYKIFLQSLNPKISEEEREKRQKKIEKNYQNQENIDENSQDSYDDEEMYFQHPDQLISIFHSLEQSNLFLITNLKEMEQEIEQSRSAYNKMKEVISEKKNELNNTKAQIIRQIVQIQANIEELKRTTNKNDIYEYHESIQSEIKRLSREAGFLPSEAKNTTALQLLKNIQKSIETQLANLKEAKEEKPSIIGTLEKHCINEKRAEKKKINDNELQQRAIKQKLQSSPERQRRKGRPIMTRSIIKKQEKQKQVQFVEPEEEIERRKYLM